MTVVALFDFETTGLDAKVEEIVQMAAVVYNTDKPEETLSFSTLANPGMRIDPKAAAVHKITDEMVADQPPAKLIKEMFWEELLNFSSGEQIVLGGHNTDFDWRFLKKHIDIPEVIKPLCTLKLARRIVPGAENHKLEYLYREHYKLVSDRTQIAHDALCDVWMCYELLQYWTDKGEFAISDSEGNADLYDIAVEFCAKPQTLQTMPFGKFKGQQFKDIPAHYLRWIVTQEDTMPSDLVFTAKQWL